MGPQPAQAQRHTNTAPTTHAKRAPYYWTDLGELLEVLLRVCADLDNGAGFDETGDLLPPLTEKFEPEKCGVCALVSELCLREPRRQHVHDA